MLDLVKYKRGVSSTVSLVLLIAIVIFASGLLYTFVLSTTSKIKNLSPINCIELQTKSVLSINDAKYMTVSEDVAVSLFRNAFDSTINSIKFKLYYPDGNSKTFDCNGCGNCEILQKGTQKVYLINTPLKPSHVEVIIDGCLLVQKFKVN